MLVMGEAVHVWGSGYVEEHGTFLSILLWNLKLFQNKINIVWFIKNQMLQSQLRNFVQCSHRKKKKKNLMKKKEKLRKINNHIKKQATMMDYKV